MLWFLHNNKHKSIILDVLFLLTVHVLFLLPLLKPGITHTHDGVLHMARIAAYSQALADGQFPVRWAGNLNFGYGTPLFIFYYPLPYFLGSVLHVLGTSFTLSFKFLLAISVVAAPVCFYLWMRKLIDPLPAMAASLLYGLAPYHFLDLYVRGDIGELLAFIFIPLVFWAIESSSIIGGTVFYALLILSHNAFALLFSPIFVFYGLIRFGKETIFWKSFVVMIILGLGLSAFFWLPALVEQKYTHSNLFVGSTYKENFSSFAKLLWSPWGFGTKVNQPGDLSPQIGIMGLAFSVLAFALYRKLRSQRTIFIFGAVLLLVGIFFSLRSSFLFWDRISFIQKFEFPWRFTALSVFGTSILTGVALAAQGLRKITFVAIALIILASIPFAITSGDDTKPDSFYLSFPSSTEFGAASTIWSAGDPSAYPKEQISLISGKGSVSDVRKGLRKHTFSVNASMDTVVLDNTMYFPSWTATVDGVKTPIQFQDANHRGLITFSVPKGIHTITVKFMDSPVRALSNALSLLTVLLCVGFLLTKKRLIYSST